MKILVVGDLAHFQECREKLGGHDYTHLTSYELAEKILIDHDVIFNFPIDEVSKAFAMYARSPVTVFFNTCAVSLAGLVQATPVDLRCLPFGFNGLPSLFNREFLEVSILKQENLAHLKKMCEKLGSGYLQVDDRVGMVTPKVICMIINEAYYTAQEGTASREDIDLAMKLGTNYPYGPFEWCERLGLKNVYRVLEAIYDDTKDERYKISALLKKEFLAEEIGH